MRCVSVTSRSYKPIFVVLTVLVWLFVLQAAQIQLDRAAQDFRQLHQERQGLIRQWDEARDAMKSRDEAIQVLMGLQQGRARAAAAVEQGMCLWSLLPNLAGWSVAADFLPVCCS